MSVDFTWEGIKPCGWGNPEIQFRGVPEHRKFIKIHMYDHAYSHDHGKVTIPYTGIGLINRDRFKEIQGPSQKQSSQNPYFTIFFKPIQSTD